MLMRSSFLQSFIVVNQDTNKEFVFDNSNDAEDKLVRLLELGFLAYMYKDKSFVLWDGDL